MDDLKDLKRRAAVIVDEVQKRLNTVLVGKDRTSIVDKLAYIRGEWRTKTDRELSDAVGTIKARNAIEDGPAWIGPHKVMALGLTAVVMGIPDSEKKGERGRQAMAVFAAACRAILHLETAGRN
jgi:hypothetical protein